MCDATLEIRYLSSGERIMRDKGDATLWGEDTFSKLAIATKVSKVAELLSNTSVIQDLQKPFTVRVFPKPETISSSQPYTFYSYQAQNEIDFVSEYRLQLISDKERIVYKILVLVACTLGLVVTIPYLVYCALFEKTNLLRLWMFLSDMYKGSWTVLRNSKLDYEETKMFMDWLHHSKESIKMGDVPAYRPNIGRKDRFLYHLAYKKTEGTIQDHFSKRDSIEQQRLFAASFDLTAFYAMLCEKNKEGFSPEALEKMIYFNLRFFDLGCDSADLYAFLSDLFLKATISKTIKEGLMRVFSDTVAYAYFENLLSSGIDIKNISSYEEIFSSMESEETWEQFINALQDAESQVDPITPVKWDKLEVIPKKDPEQNPLLKKESNPQNPLPLQETESEALIPLKGE